MSYDISGRRAATHLPIWPVTETKHDDNSDKEVKFTNSSGITFTVNIVPEQIVKKQCPSCNKVTITANPVCLKNEYHVVCQTCAPKIINSADTRCPLCKKDNTKGNKWNLYMVTNRYHDELDKTSIKCDDCKYEGTFLTAESHIHHNIPSPSPFYKPPLFEENNKAKNQSSNLTDSQLVFSPCRKQCEIGLHIYNQLKSITHELDCTKFLKELGFTDKHIKDAQDDWSKYKSPCGENEPSGWARYPLIRIFIVRGIKCLKQPDLQLIQNVLRNFGQDKLAQNLTWPDITPEMAAAIEQDYNQRVSFMRTLSQKDLQYFEHFHAAIAP